jgi:serine/threonine protein phosphatase PrpC
MGIIIASHTDIGRKKAINQDGYGVRIAESGIGEIAFAVVCDGMGGMDQGEFASSSVVLSFTEWFDKELPCIIGDLATDDFHAVFERWNELIIMQNDVLVERGRLTGANIGTTLTAVLLVQNHGIAIAHVGDSRAYKITDKMEMLTEDHTFIAHAIRSGRMTPEQAQADPRRNVLVQGVGVNAYLDPFFFRDSTPQTGTFLICTDGFRNAISEDEIFSALAERNLQTESDMQKVLIGLTEECMNRGENDNITAVIIKM